MKKSHKYFTIILFLSLVIFSVQGSISIDRNTAFTKVEKTRKVIIVNNSTASLATDCNDPMAAGRNYWVYMTPCEARALYTSSFYTSLKSFADQYATNGLTNTIDKISHTSPWVGEAEKALEAVGAVYLARKHGEFNGSYNSQLQPYLNFLLATWKSVAGHPISTWVKSQNDPSPDWYEGDISLRYWMHGAYGSYDAIRDDISAIDRSILDTWLRGLANVMWTHVDQAYEEREKNRGTASFGQCQLIALLIQDTPLFESYFNNLNFNSKKRGYKGILNAFGYTRKSTCTQIPNSYGYPLELTYRDGIHGIIPVVHAFNAMQNISHAARNGGSATWDLLNTNLNNAANLEAMENIWYRIGYGDLYSPFNSYVACLEGSGTFWDPVNYSLKGKVAESFAWIDERYDNVNWGYGSPMENLWKFRARVLRGSSAGSPGEVEAPAAPTGLTASSGNGQISISWTASIGATSYTVKRSTTSGSGYSNVATGVATPSYTNSGLTNGITYYYVVSATNASGTSANSSQVSATAVASCGSPVTWSNSSFTNQTGSFTAEFDAVPGGSTMDGVVGLSNGAASVYSQLACAIQFATDGTIKARNGSAYTAGTPVNYTAGTSYRLRMNVNVTNKTYSIYATPSGGSQQTIGTNYAFRTDQSSVTQLNNRTISTLDCSLSVSNFTAGSAVTAPAAPTGLTASSGNGQVVLSWSASTGATSYTVKRSTTSGSGYTNVATNVTTTSYTNTGLTNGTTYYYVVSASNSGGTSGNSSQASATPSSGFINETFTSSAANFTVVRGGTWTVTGGKYVLTSAATTGAANGNTSIHNTTVSGDYTLTADASATASSSAWDDFSIIFNYQNATNYYYVSLNESNDANTSGIFKISGGVITQLADITSLIIGGTTYAIKIERNGNTITAYRNGTQIATASDGTFTSGKVGFGTLNNGASFDNLIVNGGVSAVGRMRTSSTDTTSEIQRTEESPEISIYPNPTSGRFSVEVSTDMATGYLNVMDAYGRTILSKELNGNRKADIDLSEKTSGVYLVSVVKDGKKVQTKVVKR